jgi:hypothetical protein
MRIFVVAGVLLVALFLAALSAVNGDCPSASSPGVADTRAGGETG